MYHESTSHSEKAQPRRGGNHLCCRELFVKKIQALQFLLPETVDKAVTVVG